MRTFLRAATVLAVVLAAAGAYFFARTRTPSPPASAPSTVVVHAEPAAVRQIPQMLSVAASLRGGERLMVHTPVSGRVGQVLFREGERVAKGHVLARLDDTADKAALEAARAELAAAKARQQRSVELRAKGFLGSEAQEESEKALADAQARVRMLQSRIARMTVRAPIAAIAGEPGIAVGDVLDEGEDVVELQSIDPLLVEVRVPETSLPAAHTGDALQLSVDPLAGSAYGGKVVATRTVTDANGRAVAIRARVPNRDGRLRPGMPAHVRVPTSGARDALVVPDESVVAAGPESYVFKVVDGKAVRQKVELGEDAGAAVEVVAGLAAGDVVVTSDLASMRDGVAVTVAAAPAH